MSSAILSADDLNDFISPGVACIKPIETLPKTDDSDPYEVTTEDKVQAQNPVPASISLTDCLACSGCVTSAEAVLVSLQSHNEVLNTLDNFQMLEPATLAEDGPISSLHSNAKLFVASVSPQVRASLAATFGISQRRAGRLIEQLLCGPQGLKSGGQYRSGFSYVFDTNRLREACLVLGNDELLESLDKKTQPRPVITSACPGWICYAEKTHPHVLPHLSALKSPQALSGTLLKSLLSKKYNVHPAQIWHLALMPCFDKKLEASRQELTDKWWRDSNPDDISEEPIRDVDCVITSRELLSLASARDINLAGLVSLTSSPMPRSERAPFPDHYISNFLQSRPARDQLQKPEAATSGGYLHHILLSQQARHPGSKIHSIRGRNNDVVEFTLQTPDGQTIIKTARYYGFRNIQNLVRKLKPARQSKMPGAAVRRMPGSARGEGTDYSYVEVMACPGGCTNGGGQIKIDDVVDIIPKTRGEMVESTQHPQSQREWLARVDEAYFSAESEDSDNDEAADTNGHLNGHHDTDTLSHHDHSHNQVINGIDCKQVRQFLNHWSNIVDLPISKLCYTTYRVVESDVGKSKKEVSKMGDTARIAAVTSASGGGW